MSDKFRILQLSVGSLLGQVLFDLLQNRRAHFDVTGLNSLSESPWNFFCDQVYLSPSLTDLDLFEDFFSEILKQHQPQLILPGRDDDVVFLAHWREKHPQWAQQIPCGTAKLAELLRDKYLAIQWAQKQGLAHAHSFAYREGDRQALDMQKIGFPCIAKSRKGDGSRGVYVVADQAALERFLAWPDLPDLIIQEYLSPPPDIQNYFNELKWATPLFFQIPETQQFAAQTLISPQGNIGEIFCSVSHMYMGRCEYLERLEIPELEDLMRRYSEALAGEGWRGFVNLQAKPDKQGQWKMHELNLRLSGGSSARQLQGYDELAHLFQSFYPEWALSDLSVPARGPVLRRFQNFVLHNEQLQQLSEQKFWSK